MSRHMIMKEKTQTMNEFLIDKVFSTHYCCFCRESKIYRKKTDVDASTEPKTTKPIPALLLPENLATLIIAHKACSDLAARHD